MNFEATYGVYPTMITPYRKNGEVDDTAVEAMTEWYWKRGCDGIFADCQSSEIQFLTLDERVNILHTVMQKVYALAAQDPSRPRMTVVASGHVSDGFEDQVRELNAIAAEKPDALILISNRMDIANTSDEAWIADTERLIAELPAEMPLGIYECPKPYKRLLTEKMLRWCVENGRFYFVKDTCCDAELIRARLEICKGSHLKLFNANAQTLLETVRAGVYGYCGVMANFHPDLYTRLLKGDINSSDASLLQDFLGLAATIEGQTYPCCAKYYLNRFEGVAMEPDARSADVRNLTAYQKSCVDQLAELTNAIRNRR
ncbi:MAG: dihydrodipicolinate synthase family protein [Eubacteriales bacterium]|nr:dihydrodipicolinate synthase family protein [Eubacteriales bacterium]